MFALLRRSRLARFALTATALLLAYATPALAADPPPQRLFECSVRAIIIHSEIVQSAEPVPIDVVATTHAAMLTSTTPVQQTVAKYRLHELTSLASIPDAERIPSIQRNFRVTGRPSADLPAGIVVDVTYRSTNAVDAITMVKALSHGYMDFLDEPVADLLFKLTAAARERNELDRRCEELRSQGKADELKKVEMQRREAEIKHHWLQLKSRVGKFRFVMLIDDGTITEVK